jgi:hypothetical protein
MSGSADGDLRTRTQFLGLTTEACGLLRGFWPILEPRLPELLEGFYQHVIGIPALKLLLGERIPRLKQAQTAHWKRLFSGQFDAAYFQGVHTIGLMHHKIGLEPRWYIGGYAYVLNRLVALAVRTHRWSPGKLVKLIEAVNAGVMLDMDIAISVYQDALVAEKEQRGKRLDVLLRDFESKTAVLAGIVASAATELEATSRAMAATTGETSAQASNVTAAVEAASVNVQTVASAAEELSASISEISRQVAQSSEIAERAVQDANRTDAIVKTLADGAQKIGDVVNLISTICRADQPAGTERHNRGRARRRRRQRLCCGGVGGKEPGEPDRKGHRGYQPTDRDHPAGHQGGGHRDRSYRANHRRGQAHRLDDR